MRGARPRRNALMTDFAFTILRRSKHTLVLVERRRHDPALAIALAAQIGGGVRAQRDFASHRLRGGSGCVERQRSATAERQLARRFAAA